MQSLRLTAKRFLRRAPLPHRLRVWLRPIGRRLAAWLIRYPLHSRARKRIVSRAVPPSDLPRLDAAMGLLPFALPIHRDPHISIIIPFHDQPELTVRCLYGISRHQTAATFEVIAVDDGSDDTTRRAVGQVAGLRVVRHSSAQGFVVACSAGAQEAKGKFLLFVNNDTFVQPGWL